MRNKACKPRAAAVAQTGSIRISKSSHLINREKTREEAASIKAGEVVPLTITIEAGIIISSRSNRADRLVSFNRILMNA